MLTKNCFIYSNSLFDRLEHEGLCTNMCSSVFLLLLFTAVTSDNTITAADVKANNNKQAV